MLFVDKNILLFLIQKEKFILLGMEVNKEELFWGYFLILLDLLDMEIVLSVSNLQKWKVYKENLFKELLAEDNLLPQLIKTETFIIGVMDNMEHLEMVEIQTQKFLYWINTSPIWKINRNKQ